MSGFTSENLTLMESKLKTKEDALNMKESILSEEYLKIDNEIDIKAQKIAKSFFEKLCAEKDQVIKEKEKIIKNLDSEINQLYSKFGSYLKKR